MAHPVVLVKYDPRWLAVYQEEKELILEAVGEKALAIEHIGSTAVLGLGSKPIVDIMLGVLEPVDAEESLPRLREIGYDDVTPQPGNPDWYYCLGTHAHANHDVYLHLHIVRFESDHWANHLLFRDYLQIHPEAAKQYSELKSQLAVRYGNDRQAYTDGKKTFVDSVVTLARQKHAVS